MFTENGVFEYWQQKRAPRFWYFRLRAKNTEIIADSEAYTTKAMCLKGIKSIQAHAALASVVEIDIEAPPTHKVETAKFVPKAKKAPKPAPAVKTPAAKPAPKKAAHKKATVKKVVKNAKNTKRTRI
jgi:uncharacterized protein